MPTLQDLTASITHKKPHTMDNNLPLREKILIAYHNKTLTALQHISKEKSTPEVKLDKFKEYLSQNWNLVKGTSLCYTAIPENDTTLILCEVAQWVVEEKNKTVKAGEEPLGIVKTLMPTVSTDSNVDEYPALGPEVQPTYKNKVLQEEWVNVPVDIAQVLKTHIISKDGMALLPVKLLTEVKITAQNVSLPNPYFDYNNPEAKAYLEKEEVNRLEAYSNATRELIEAKKNYETLVNDKSYLLGHLKQLTRLLYFNSVSGIGQETNAGLGTYTAIINFNNYYGPLDKSEKDRIPGTSLIKEKPHEGLRGEIETLLDLASNPLSNKNATQNVQTCIALRRNGIEKEMSQYEVLLSQIDLKGENKEKLIDEAKNQFEKAKAHLKKEIDNKKELGGNDNLSLTHNVLQTLGVSLKIDSLENVRDLVSLNASEIAILCQSAENQKQIVEQFDSLENFISFVIETPPEKLKTLLLPISNALVQKIDLKYNDFIALVSMVNIDQAAVILEVMQEYLSQHLFSAKDLSHFLTTIGPEKTEAFLHNFDHTLANLKILDWVFQAVNNEQKSRVFEQVKDKLPALIKNTKDLNVVLRILSAEQRIVLYESLKEKIPEFIKSAEDLPNPVYLAPQQRSDLCNRMSEKLLQDSFIKNKADFATRSYFIQGTEISLDIQFGLIIEYISRYAAADKNPLEVLLELEGINNSDLMTFVSDYVVQNFNLDVLFKTNVAGNNFLVQKLTNKSFPPILLQIIKSLDTEKQAELLSHTNEYGENMMMLGMTRYPQVIPALLEILQKLPTETQATVLSQKSSIKNSMILFAIRVPQVVLPLLNHMQQNLSREVQATILKQKSENGKNGLMDALSVNTNAVDPLLLFISKLSPKDQAEILNFTGVGNTLLYAITEKPALVPSLLEGLSTLSIEEQVTILSSLLSEKVKNWPNALIYAVQNQPELLIPLIEKIKQLPAEESEKILKKINWLKLLRTDSKKPEVSDYIAAEIASYSKDQQANLITEYLNNNAHANKEPLEVLIELEGLTHKDLLPIVANYAMEKLNLEVLYKTNNGGQNLLGQTICNKKGTPLLLQIIGFLSEEKQTEILSHRDIHDQNALIFASYWQPESIPSFLELLKKQPIKSQASIFMQITKEHKTHALPVALAYNNKGVVPLLDYMKSNLTRDEQACILKAKDINGKNAFMVAKENNYALEPLLLLINKLDVKDQAEILSSSAILFANTEKPSLLPDLLADLTIEEKAQVLSTLLLTKVEKAEAPGLIFKEIAKFPREQQIQIIYGTNSSKGLHIAAQYQPQIVEYLLELLQELPLPKQGEILAKEDEGYNPLMKGVFYNPQVVEPILSAINNLLPENRKTILCQKSDRFYDNIMTLATLKPQNLEPLFEAINRLENPNIHARFLKDYSLRDDLNPLMRAVIFAPQVVPTLLKEVDKLSAEDQKFILTSQYHGHNPITLAIRYNPQIAPQIQQHVAKLPEDIQKVILNQIYTEGERYNLPEPMSTTFYWLSGIKGSSFLSDKLANQSYSEKQNVIKLQLTKFLLSLARAEGNEENIYKDFKQLVQVASKQRNVFHLGGMAASCKDLLEKLTNINLPEKKQLNEALGLELSEEQMKAPKKFKVALEKFVAKLDKQDSKPGNQANRSNLN